MTQKLSGKTVELTFDEQTCVLKRFKCVQTGWEFLSGEEGLSFEIGIPKDDFPGNTVKGIQNKPQKVSLGINDIEILWDGLTDECGETLNISFLARIKLTSRGAEFSAHIENHSQYMIEHVSYPCFSHVERPIDAQRMSFMVSSYSGIWEAPIYPTFTTMGGYWSSMSPFVYNGSPESPYMILNAGNEGIYFGRHDTMPSYRMVYFGYLYPEVRDSHNFRYDCVSDKENTPYVILSTTHIVFLASDAQMDLSNVSVEPYQGTWENGLICFKQWYETHFQPRRPPEWARKIHSWYQLQLCSYGYGVRYRFNDLPQIGRELLSNGVTAIQITGWTMEGMDGALPCHEPDPRLGTRDELKNAIAELERMGIRVIMYCKFVYADMRTKEYKTELNRYSSKDIYGLTHNFGGYPYDRPSMLTGSNAHRLAIMCMNDERWRKRCLSEVAKIIELGASGLLFDEVFVHYSNEYCFDSTHGHPIPAYEYIGDVRFAQEMRKLAIDMGRDDFLLAGEALPALYRPYYDLSYFRFLGNGRPDYRYLDSSYPMVCTARALEDRSPLNFCLMCRTLISYEPRHFKGRIGDFPMLIEYGSKIDALRKRYHNRLWEVEFIPTDGISLNNEIVLYSLMRSNTCGLMTLVIVNPSETEQSIDCSRLKGWMVVSPENAQQHSVGNILNISALSVVALFEPTPS